MSFVRGFLHGIIFRVPQQDSMDAANQVFIGGFQCGAIILLTLIVPLLFLWSVS